MDKLQELLSNNRAWVEKMNAQDPGFFESISNAQNPEVLWIGCSDSRVPANQIVDLLPGELFVHRNVANVIPHTDLNCLSVIQFAVQVLKVKHIIVCGHYGCAGVKAAVTEERYGIVDNWIRHIIDVKIKHSEELETLDNEKDRVNRLCELNVIAQVASLCTSSIVKDAWADGRSLSLHGWIYDVADGLLNDLEVSVSG